MKDYFEHTKNPACADIPLLKIGRHFRLDNGEKVVVARDETEGEKMIHLRRKGSKVFVPEGFSAPVVMLEGSNEAAALMKMREYTNRLIPEDAAILATCDSGVTRFLLKDHPANEWMKNRLDTPA